MTRLFCHASPRKASNFCQMRCAGRIRRACWPKVAQIFLSALCGGYPGEPAGISGLL